MIARDKGSIYVSFHGRVGEGRMRALTLLKMCGICQWT
jgi:hypothetical protein